MTTLIVGCGYVGSALAERLVARGEHVVAITRSARPLPPGVEPLLASLPDPKLRLPKHVQRVVYAVAPDERTDDAYRRAYPEGVRSVLDALHRARHDELARIVLVSSTAVYAEDEGGLVSDRAPHATGTPERIVEAEQAIANAGLDHYFDLPYEPGIVARLSGIYGPGRDRIVRAIREGRVPGEPSRVGNRIHRDDAAAALEHLLFAGDLSRTRFDVTDDTSVPMGEVFEWIARRVGVELDPASTTVGAKLTGKRLDNTPLRASGFTLRYPSYREGYGALLAG